MTSLTPRERGKGWVCTGHYLWVFVISMLQWHPYPKGKGQGLGHAWGTSCTGGSLLFPCNRVCEGQGLDVQEILCCYNVTNIEHPYPQGKGWGLGHVQPIACGSLLFQLVTVFGKGARIGWVQATVSWSLLVQCYRVLDNPIQREKSKGWSCTGNYMWSFIYQCTV